jgi:hypothetical protein
MSEQEKTTEHKEALERNLVAQYALGELSEEERNRFEEHLFDCSECMAAVRAAYLMVRGAETTLNRQLFKEPVPAPRPVASPPPSRTAWRWSLAALPYAAVLLLSVGVGVQYVALERARAPEAIDATLLHPQSKGVLPQVVLPKAGGPLYLELELVDPVPPPRYEWKVRPAGSDRVLAHGQAMPLKHQVVLLKIPSYGLRPGAFEADLSPLSVPPAPPASPSIYSFEIVAEPAKRTAAGGCSVSDCTLNSGTSCTC